MNKPLMLRSCLLLLLAFLLFTSCNKDHLFDWTKSTGKIVTELRPSGDFQSLYLEDDVDVVVYTDTTTFVRATAGQNILDGIITEVIDGTLHIRNENRANWVRSFKNSYTVEIGMSQPLSILYYGSGKLTLEDTIRTNDFTFDCWNGSGTIKLLLNTQTSHLNIHIGRCDITATGRSQVCYFYQNDTGIITASNLQTDFCYLRNSGTGNCYVNVTKELGVEIQHTGNVYYRGTPYKIDQQITGSGKLYHEN
jgi:hypothetical protein